MFGFGQLLSWGLQVQAMRMEKMIAAERKRREAMMHEQAAAAEFARRHNCRITIIKPDGTMVPGS